MTLIALTFGLIAIIAAYVALIFRDRAVNLEIQADALLAGQRKLNGEQDKLIQAQRRHINYLRRVMDEFVEAADAMNECNVEMERRNAWLEQRRQVILVRWWRRPSQRRRLVAWQVRKGGGA